MVLETIANDCERLFSSFFSEGIQKDLRLFKPDRYPQNMAK